MRFKEKTELNASQINDQARSGIPNDSYIRRKVILETIQYPLTLTALALCIISTVFLLLLSRVFGITWEALALSLVSGIMAVSSYIHQYRKKYPARAREIMEHLDQEREKSNEVELKQLIEKLRTGFFKLDSADGLTSLAQLVSEYEQLQTALSKQRGFDPLAVSLIPSLAEETFRRGLSVLSEALELIRLIQWPDRTRLEMEIKELEKEIQSLIKSSNQKELIQVKERLLDIRKERLNSLNKLQLNIGQLLCSAQRCDSVLHSTRIELAAVRAGSSQTSVDSVVESLQERIKQVREVQDELKKLGY